jgi:hypothetical protein
MVGGKFCSTMDSIAGEFNSLVKESLVFRHFSARFIFRSIREYFIQHMWCSGTCDVSDIVVFENKINLGREIFGLVGINTQAYTLQLIT